MTLGSSEVAGLTGMHVGGGQAPQLQMASMSGGADSAEANFANSLLPGGAEDAGGPATTSGAQGSLDPGILVDNHAPHFTGAAAASPSLFTGPTPCCMSTVPVCARVAGVTGCRRF